MSQPLFPIETADGVFGARFSPNGLVRLCFPDSLDAPLDNPSTPNTASSAEETQWRQQTERCVRTMLLGDVPENLPPLDLVGTPFQRRVWDVLLTVPRGKTISYADVAIAIGQPGAMRAVGRACGANPIPLLVPCHRILAGKSRMGGFTGGLSWKRLLLSREGWTAGGDLPLFDQATGSR